LADIDNLVLVTLVADANTPAELLPRAGQQIGVPFGTTMPAPGYVGVFVGIAGTLRQGAQGLEWLMAADTPTPPSGAAPQWAQDLVNAAVTATAARLHPVLLDIKAQLQAIANKVGA
jgi:hypothetical protein